MMRRFYDHKFSPRSEGDWNKPGQWNRAAQKRGHGERRPLVLVEFDPFADRSGIDGVHVIADDQRMLRLFAMVEQCSALDWLIVTKCPQNIRAMVPGTWLPFQTFGVKREWPKQCIIGVQFSALADANDRIPHLINLPMQLRIVVVSPRQRMDIGALLQAHGIGWVITTGETWAMHPDWIRVLRDASTSSKIPFWFDSWGRWVPTSTGREFTKPRVEHGVEVVKKIGRGCMIYTSCAPGEYPDAQPVELVGPRRSGRIIDGREWTESPRIGERGSHD
jgi:hypothetical protein